MMKLLLRLVSRAMSLQHLVTVTSLMLGTVVHAAVISNTGSSGARTGSTVPSDISTSRSHRGIHSTKEGNKIYHLVKSWIHHHHITPSQQSESPRSMVGDLRGLYKTLKYHPALTERRLHVGSKVPPTSTPVFPAEINHEISKRSQFDIGLAVPVCPFTTQWRLLRSAKDINNTAVEVFQPDDDSNRYQWFYTVACDHNRGGQGRPDGLQLECCMGVDTDRFTSRCIPRKSFVMALIRRPGSRTYDWDYIQVDTSCNCAISPRTPALPTPSS